ncbi:MAG TPA: AEC family transporter, partial [Planosporangium sp.]|nr:AEC family transporter [Planosporangium sp.]
RLRRQYRRDRDPGLRPQWPALRPEARRGRGRCDGRRRALLNARLASATGDRLAQPLLAYLFGLLAQLRPAELLALVVCAALPTAQNAYIFAREYGQADSVARGTVIASTGLSILTLASIGCLLG